MNWSADEVAEVPPAVVTVTSDRAGRAGGAVAVICVAESTVIGRRRRCRTRPPWRR